MKNSTLTITRRSFMRLSSFLPLAGFSSRLGPGDHHFRYEHVLGTSLDLVISAPEATQAERGALAILDEIHRLSGILSTRNPSSEISLLRQRPTSSSSPELIEIFRIYDYWEAQTGGRISIRPGGSDSPVNIDALGKAFIIDRAVESVLQTESGIQSLVLNIGGDIVAYGRPCEISVANPHSPFDNGTPLTRLLVQNMAIATSGTYARGAHLVDARTGEPAAFPYSSATAVARNAVTANALALALCITEGDEALGLVDTTPEAAALRTGRSGSIQRTRRLAALERPIPFQRIRLSNWPPEFQLTISLTLTEGSAGTRHVRETEWRHPVRRRSCVRNPVGYRQL